MVKVPGVSELFPENASQLGASSRQPARERSATPPHGTHLRFPSPGPLRLRTKRGSEPDVLDHLTAPADETAGGPASRIHPESLDFSESVARERPGSCNAVPERIAVSFG